VGCPIGAIRGKSFQDEQKGKTKLVEKAPGKNGAGPVFLLPLVGSGGKVVGKRRCGCERGVTQVPGKFLFWEAQRHVEHKMPV